MEIQAHRLYKALLEFGKLPKTFEVTETTVQMDLSTNKSRKSTRAHRYSVIRVWVDEDKEHSLTVDFDGLRALSKKLKKDPMDIRFSSGDVALLISYKGGDCCFFNLEATPSAELNLDHLQGVGGSENNAPLD